MNRRGARMITPQCTWEIGAVPICGCALCYVLRTANTHMKRAYQLTSTTTGANQNWTRCAYVEYRQRPPARQQTYDHRRRQKLPPLCQPPCYARHTRMGRTLQLSEASPPVRSSPRNTQARPHAPSSDITPLYKWAASPTVPCVLCQTKLDEGQTPLTTWASPLYTAEKNKTNRWADGVGIDAVHLAVPYPPADEALATTSPVAAQR